MSLQKLLTCSIVLLALIIAGCSPESTTKKAAETQQWMQILAYQDDDRDPERRLAAVRLGVHRRKEAVDLLARQLIGDRDPLTRAACAFALGRIGGERAVNTLIAALNDPAHAVRLEAVRAMDRNVDQKVVPRLLELAAQGDQETSLLAQRVLDAAGKYPETPIQRQAVAVPPLPPGPAVYVDPITGDDANDGSETLPLKTVAKGLALLKPSGTLFLAGNTKEPIREAVVIPAALSGEPGNPTRIRAWPRKARPLLQPTVSLPAKAFTVDSDGLYHAKITQPVFGAFIVRGPDKIEILTITPEKSGLKPGSCWYDLQQTEVILDPGQQPLTGNVELAINDDALRIEGAHDVEIQGLDVRYAPDTGLDASAALRTSFIDCSAAYCDRHGIFFYYSPFSLVRSCRASKCSYQGFSIRSSPQTVISSCLAVDNKVDGYLFLYDSDECVIIDSRARGNFRGLSFIEGSDDGRVVGGEYQDNQTAAVSFESGSLRGSVVETR